MSQSFVRRVGVSVVAPPGCCVKLQSTGRVPAALGVLGLGVGANQEEFTVVASGLPQPSSLGGGFTRYVAWVFGGGTLRLGITLQGSGAGPGGTYAGGIGPLVPAPLSEVALSAEPPFTATLTGPVVLLGSFAFCV